LVVDDDPDALQFAANALAKEFEVVTCSRGDEGIDRAAREAFDLVVTDLAMPRPDGFDVLRAIASLDRAPGVIVLTATDKARETMEALRLGARDYIVKPSTDEEIRDAVSRGLQGRRGDTETAAFGLVGISPAMARLRQLIPLLARSSESVLVIGETGTGKELVARGLHEQGPRCAGPFVVHNVAATPSELSESLFFGHARGAFSGAHADHAGLFEQASGGTLFLDEMDSLPLALQPKLLRALECRRIQRVGGNVDRSVDVRIVAASATDVSELVARGTFRADLYYRLRQLEVVMPPLRDRPEDIPLLIDHILCEWTCERGQTARLSPLAEDLVLAHHWPGNVRELRNALRGAAVLAESGVITPQQLPRAVRNAGGSTPVVERLENVERQAIARALDRAGGNQSQAARLLGIDRGTLARKLLRRPL